MCVLVGQYAFTYIHVLFCYPLAHSRVCVLSGLCALTRTYVFVLVGQYALPHMHVCVSVGQYAPTHIHVCVLLGSFSHTCMCVFLLGLCALTRIKFMCVFC